MTRKEIKISTRKQTTTTATTASTTKHRHKNNTWVKSDFFTSQGTLRKTQSLIFNVRSVQQLDPDPVKINMPSVVGVWIFSGITHWLTDDNLRIL